MNSKSYVYFRHKKPRTNDEVIFYKLGDNVFTLITLTPKIRYEKH